MKRLRVDHIILLHDLLIRQTGGLDGIRDRGLLESAVNAPFATFDREHLYPTIRQKAASLGFGLVKNHPFVDGNKRVGILAMITFLQLNGITLACSDDELIRIGLGLADGSVSEKLLLEWIIANS